MVNSRTIIRSCANAIRALHRGEAERADELSLRLRVLAERLEPDPGVLRIREALPEAKRTLAEHVTESQSRLETARPAQVRAADREGPDGADGTGSARPVVVRAPTPISSVSVGSQSLTTTSPLLTLHRDEYERSRLYLKMDAALATAVLVAIPFMGGEPISRAIVTFGMVLAIVSSLLLLWRLQDADNYTPGLLAVGGLVTSAEAGLAVVDWPNSFGYNMFLYPLARMTGGVYYEHAHRLLGSLVGLSTLVLALQLQSSERRGWVRGLGWLTLGAVEPVAGKDRAVGTIERLAGQLAELHATEPEVPADERPAPLPDRLSLVAPLEIVEAPARRASFLH